MKKNDWALIISVIIYSFLFYEQSAGLNFLLFNISIVGLLLFRIKELIKSKMWLLVVSGAILSSFLIFMYSSALAIWANLFSLIILSALSFNPKISFLTAIFQTICNVGASLVFVILDWIDRKSKNIVTEEKRPFYVKLFLIVIPFLIAVVFFLFYQSANPLFYDFTKDINLDWISIGWIFFTLGGFFLMYGFFNVRRLRSIGDMDVNTPLTLTIENTSKKSFFSNIMRIDTENLSGIILFSMLNILLLIVNGLDLNYLWFDGKLPEGINHKGFVHDGVGVLITSIVVAILIILFYFRGSINFYEKNKWIRIMTYFWIAQNIFMIFSTAYRNNMYIQESGLSYKKIGVYVYLILTVIGLVTTFIKVYKFKTNWYLFKINATVYYVFLVLGGIPNWDVIITDYNIKKHTVENKELEKYFLLDLSYKNLPQLISLPDSIKSKEDENARNYYNYTRSVYYQNFKSDLDKKLFNFLSDYSEMEWKSYCVEKRRTYNDLLPLFDKINVLDLSGWYKAKSLKGIYVLHNLKELNLSNNYFSDMAEIAEFKKLEKLNLSSNGLDSLKKLPLLPNLKTLDLSNNSLTDLRGIERLMRLEVLDLSGYSLRVKNYKPLLALKNLKIIYLNDYSNNYTNNDLKALQELLPNVQIINNALNQNK